MERASKSLLALASLCAAAAAFLPPHGAAVAADGGGVCGKVSCGMGTCSESSNDTFGFACDCNPGWRRSHLATTTMQQQFAFLPCVIPNCTIHSSCQDGSSSPTPAPSPPAPPPAGLPPLITFDPCLMQYCGDGGTCEKVSEFKHRCSCRDGYANLLNDTSYPCYQQCSLGSDCKGLGINVINGSTPSSSPPAPFSVTVNKSGAGAVADAPADALLLGLLLLITFYGLQAAIW